MPLACPDCGRTIAPTDLKPGRFRVPCPSCGRVFLLEVGDGPTPTVAVRPIEPEGNPTALGHQVDLWARAREIGSLVASVILERAGWAWKFLADREARIGGTLIVRPLGRTSRGSLASGRQLLLGRDVLVRILPADWGGADPVATAEANRLAYAGARVTHPNLAPRSDLAEDRGRRFVFEEAPRGPTLALRAAEADWPGGLDAIASVLHASRGLLAAHEQGMAHGDPSAEEIRVEPGGLLRLAGLGLATPTGTDPARLALALARDVNRLGETLESVARAGPERAEGYREALAIAARMKAAGTGEGYRDLAEAIRAMEGALPASSGDDGVRFAAIAGRYRDAPLVKLRRNLVVGALVASGFFSLVFLRLGHVSTAIALVGLVAGTAFARAVIRAANRRRPGLFGPAREVLLGGRAADWWTLVGVLALGVGVLVALGWIGGAIATLVLAAALATAFVMAIDRPIEADREEALIEARRRLASSRARGEEESELRATIRSQAGAGWEGLYEELFGLAATASASVPASRGLRPAGWRFALHDWLVARIVARREVAARRRFEAIEEAGQVARRVNEMTARRRSRRIAEALVVVGREIERTSIVGEGTSATFRVAPRPIPDLLRDAFERPDAVLTSTWSDDREQVDRGRLPLRLLAAAIGPRVRLLAGGVLIAGFLLWADQVGLVSSAEIREKAERAIAGRDPAHLGGIRVDIDRADAAGEPLVVPGLPAGLTRTIAGPGAGVAGLILLASSAVAGSRIALSCVPAAGLAWFGPRLGLPAIGPLSASLVADLAGLALFAIGLVVERRLPRLTGTR